MPNPILIRRALANASGGFANPETSAWALQIVANGGAAPSGATLSAVDTYISTEKSNLVWNKLNVVNLIAADSTTALLTPLRQGCSTALWTIVNGITLDVNGVRRSAGGTNHYIELFDGSTSLLSNGIASVNSAHICFYRYNNTNQTTSFDFGAQDGASNEFILNGFYSGVGAQSYIGNQTATDATSPGFGYYCGSRTSSTRNDLYFANSSTAHSSVANNTSANTTGLPALHSFPLLILNNNGSLTGNCDSWISYVSLGAGLSSTDSQNHYNAIQALRSALGGGFR